MESLANYSNIQSNEKKKKLTVFIFFTSHYSHHRHHRYYYDFCGWKERLPSSAQFNHSIIKIKGLWLWLLSHIEIYGTVNLSLPINFARHHWNFDQQQQKQQNDREKSPAISLSGQTSLNVVWDFFFCACVCVKLMAFIIHDYGIVVWRAWSDG